MCAIGIPTTPLQTWCHTFCTTGVPLAALPDPFPVVHLAHLFLYASPSPREVRENFNLERSANEWVLLHGTSAEAADAIASTDFTMRLAGSATGTLYGRGTSPRRAQRCGRTGMGMRAC